MPLPSSLMKRNCIATVAMSCILLSSCIAGWFFYYSEDSGRRIIGSCVTPSSRPADAASLHDKHQDRQLHFDFAGMLRRFNNSVPPVVHQSWKTHQLPTKRAERWSASWSACFPGWERRLWSDDDNLALVRDHYPWFLPVYLAFRKPVERADVVRYFYMYHYGGIYADLDAICLRSFPHLMESVGLLFGGMDRRGGDRVLNDTYVQNSFMASRPGHPFWMRLISRVMLYHQLGRSGPPEYLTGPYALMDELRDYLNHKPHDVKIYPGKYFNPFSWWVNTVPACRDLGRMNATEEAACVRAFPEAYVIQLHTQSWKHGHL